MTEHTSSGPNGRSLQQMQRAADRMAATVPASTAGQRRYLAMLGLALGLLAGAVVLTAHRSPAGLMLSLSGFVIALQFALTYRQSTRTVSGRGTRRRFAVVGGATAVLYAAVVLSATLHAHPLPWWAGVAGAVLVAAPAVITAAVPARRS